MTQRSVTLSLTHLFRCLIATAVLGSIAEPALATQKSVPGNAADGPSYLETFGKPLFIYDTFAWAAPESGKVHLDVHVAFVNDVLQFVQESPHAYRARYEMAVEILNKDGRRRAGEIVRGEIEAGSFEETNARNVTNRRRFRFTLPAAEYKLRLEITDLDTRRHLVRNADVTAPAFHGQPLTLSDVMFVDAVQVDSSRVVGRLPNLRRSLDDPDARFGAYFEVYAQKADSIRLHVGVYDRQNNALLLREMSVWPESDSLGQFLPIEPMFKLPGFYVLTVEARSGEEKAMARGQFFVQSVVDSLAGRAFEASEAYFGALKHVTDEDDYEEAAKLSREARRSWIARFWTQRDPTPATARNELREEFRRRVWFTLRHFSVAADGEPGWATDRGRVYIVYGPPSQVQRRSVDGRPNPYEIWYYKNLDKRFFFLDRANSGHFKLVHED